MTIYPRSSRLPILCNTGTAFEEEDPLLVDVGTCRSVWMGPRCKFSSLSRFLRRDAAQFGLWLSPLLYLQTGHPLISTSFLKSDTFSHSSHRSYHEKWRDTQCSFLSHLKSSELCIRTTHWSSKLGSLPHQLFIHNHVC